MNKQKGYTLIELMMGTLVIGILAAVAIPVYSGYSTRAKISDPLLVASRLKTGVSEAFFHDGLAGVENFAESINTSDYDNDAITNIVVEAAGTITLTLGGIEKLGTDNQIVFSPHIRGKSLQDSDLGNIQWVCAGQTGSQAKERYNGAATGSVKDKYLPGNCR